MLKKWLLSALVCVFVANISLAQNQKIVFDNLIPRHPENAGLSFDDVPDGSFNAFVWKKKRWQYEDNVDVRMQGVPLREADPNKKSGLSPR